ncbi:DNA-directed RNA polymerase 1 mitochondrial-like [Tripterygium wilfordii]|uniref:DNA-directed RNA polymerase 1 mitochondrial-like n=1 Tax=Tripterygium wilfordii TaxID=458696 RepID=A0A7J7DGE6_TRIWF|nr:DNA-directed RNA polymerase 1 mitochondrial-like [Tripterygium wilfordii]
MWRNLAKQASSKNIRFSSNSMNFTSGSNFADKIRPPEACTGPQYCTPLLGFPRIGALCNQKVKLDRYSFIDSSNSFGVSFSFNCMRRRYGSVTEAIVSTDEDYSGSEEIQELIEEMNKEDKRGSQHFKDPKKMVAGIGIGKYYVLRKKQIKMETEAWETAAKEYQGLLTDMCEHKLAPNLPDVKSLFLGWFEPLRDVIVAEQELCGEKNTRLSHAPYFNKLPADMMAVITMHKLMGLLMTTTGESGSIRVVQAACQIGEAIDHEARIHWFLEKTKKKKNTADKHPEDELDI